MRGRKPKPTEQKIAEGNPGKQPLPEPIVLGLPATLDPPEDLPETAKEFWRETVPTLREYGVVSAVDIPALEMMATAYARAKQAGRMLAEEGHLIQNANGQLVEHPSLAVERQAQAQFLKLAENFALTPTARTRLGLAELQRRSLAQEVEDMLGKPELEPA